MKLATICSIAALSIAAHSFCFSHVMCCPREIPAPHTSFLFLSIPVHTILFLLIIFLSSFTAPSHKLTPLNFLSLLSSFPVKIKLTPVWFYLTFFYFPGTRDPHISRSFHFASCSCSPPINDDHQSPVCLHVLRNHISSSPLGIKGLIQASHQWLQAWVGLNSWLILAVRTEDCASLGSNRSK